jgi:hypothetical protein
MKELKLAFTNILKVVSALSGLLLSVIIEIEKEMKEEEDKKKKTL